MRILQTYAEGIEHHVHPITVDHIARFVNFVGKNPAWFQAFEMT